MILHIARKMLSVPPARITREQALVRANDFFGERKLLIDAPVVTELLRHWKVLARGEIKGSPWVLIDNQTGAITKSGIPPR